MSDFQKEPEGCMSPADAVTVTQCMWSRVGLEPARIACEPSPPARAVLSAVRSGLPPSLSSPPHRAELDARRHNRWYTTTGYRSARISCRSTLISPNFTGASGAKGKRGDLRGQTRLWQSPDPAFTGGIWCQGKLWCLLKSRSDFGINELKAECEEKAQNAWLKDLFASVI